MYVVPSGLHQKTNSEAKINPQFQAGFIGIGYHKKKVNCSVNH